MQVRGQAGRGRAEGGERPGLASVRRAGAGAAVRGADGAGPGGAGVSARPR